MQIEEARRKCQMIYELVKAGRKLIHQHRHILNGRKPRLIFKPNPIHAPSVQSVVKNPFMNYPGEKDIHVVHDMETPQPTRAPLLSILTPAVPSRWRQLEWLCCKIERQIGNLAVEHLVLLDNKRRTVGEKRDALLRASRGDYIAFVDDDDDISDDYVSELVNAIDRSRSRDIDHQTQAPTLCVEAAVSAAPDVITFLQKATVNSVTAVIEFGLGNQNEPFVIPIPPAAGEGPSNPPTVVKRNAWHICAWRRALAIGSAFPPVNYGEDWAFAEPLCMIAQTSLHIDKVLHFYRHDSTKTEAPPPSAIPEPTRHPPMFGDAGELYKNPYPVPSV